MKDFLKYILLIISIIVLVLVSSDLLYTYIYHKNINRNKVQLAINSNETFNKDCDLIILGTSRAENHFETQQFINKGLNVYNFGSSGATSEENALLLELLIENDYKIKTILLQADLDLSVNSFSEHHRGNFMPFIRDKTVSDYYENKITDFEYLKKIPFYRYLKYDKVIGFRETLFCLFNKEGRYMKDGFVPLTNEGKNLSYDIKKLKPQKNDGYLYIKKLCEKHNIKLLVISTPMCENLKGWEYFDQLKEMYPEIHHYERAVQKDSLFDTCGHLNQKGARILTQRIIKDFF